MHGTCWYQPIRCWGRPDKGIHHGVRWPSLGHATGSYWRLLHRCGCCKVNCKIHLSPWLQSHLCRKHPSPPSQLVKFTRWQRPQCQHTWVALCLMTPDTPDPDNWTNPRILFKTWGPNGLSPRSRPRIPAKRLRARCLGPWQGEWSRLNIPEVTPKNGQVLQQNKKWPSLDFRKPRQCTCEIRID